MGPVTSVDSVILTNFSRGGTPVCKDRGCYLISIKGQMNQKLDIFSFECYVFIKYSNELDEALRRYWNVKITVFYPS